MVTEKEIAGYYDKIYSKKGSNSMRPYSYYRQVFDYFGKIKPGSKIVDIGVGTGYILKTASERGLKVYGVDISSESINVSKQNAPEAELHVAPGENLPFQNSFFDYVVCFGSLEHFLDMDKGLEEMLRVAKPDAKFMIVVPNINYFLWKLTGQYGTKQQDMKEVLMNYGDWKKFFEKHGLSAQSVYHDPWPWQSLKIFKYRNPVKIVKRTIARILWLFMPVKYTYQFIFILTR